MKFLVLASFFMSLAHADVVMPSHQVTITGKEANKIADLGPSGADENGEYAEGKASFSCAKKNKAKNFTCVIKVLRK
jgi:hypothetical protein